MLKNTSKIFKIFKSLLRFLQLLVLANIGQQFSNMKTTRFFISNAFISDTRLKLVKNQANAKQHPETELLLIENYSHVIIQK